MSPATCLTPSTAAERALYREGAYARGAQFLAEVKRIVPVIAAGRAESERLGKVAQASVDAMEEVGFFRAMTPLQWGGLEMDPASFFAGIMEIAAADASAGWIGGQLNVHSFEIALMSERMQAEFWQHGPNARASSSYAPIGQVQATEGGWRLNGVWTFSSGVDHSDWAILGDRQRSFVVPKSDFHVDHASWDVQGLKGTGSKSLTLKDVFVPQYRTHEFTDTYNDANPGWAVNDRPLYRLSWLGMFQSAVPNSAIGAATGGVDAFFAQSKLRHSKQGTGAAVSENPFMHLKVAKAMGNIRAVRERHLANWRELFDTACRGEDSPPLTRLRVRFEAADCTATSYDAVTDLWTIAGAAAIASSNPLQQTMRDLMAMRNHGSAALEANAGAYIKAMLGVPAAPFADFGTLAYYR